MPCQAQLEVAHQRDPSHVNGVEGTSRKVHTEVATVIACSILKWDEWLQQPHEAQPRRTTDAVQALYTQLYL